jgi:hypothetical protein
MSVNALSPSETLDAKLRLEEFRILRGEIELRSSEGRAMERNVMIISAAIYGFLLAPQMPDANDGYRGLAWYLPPLLNLLALIRWRESVKLIIALSIYIRTIEGQLMNKKGWETFLFDRRRTGSNPILSVWYVLFWFACITGTLIAAIVHQKAFGSNTTVASLVLGIAMSGVVLFILWPKEEEK